jgi:hypothetical protein
MRIYSGMNEQLQVKAVIVGVDDKDKDMLPSLTESGITDEEYFIGEEGQSCPPICPPPSHLNP